MQITSRRLIAVTAAVIVAIGIPGAPARADDRIPLGGGSGIVVNEDALCTLTTIGTDARGELIGFTSAHCGGPGAVVAAEAAKDRGTVGTMVAGNDSLDYAIIQFDKAKVAPVANVGGFLINGIGPDPVCRSGGVQTRPHHRQLVRRDVGAGTGSGHDSDAGVRTAG